MTYHHRRTSPRLFAVALLAFAAGITVSAQRPAGTAPRRPDFHGMWLNNTATPLERPVEMGDRSTFTEAEALAYEGRYQLDRTIAISRDKEFELDAAADVDTYEPGRVLPGRRNSLITDPPDGRVPALTPLAKRVQDERARHLNEHYAENPEDLTNAERCLQVANTSAPPMLPAFYNNTIQIVQTADHVMLLSEMIHDVRMVAMNRQQHLPDVVRQWKGDSIGRWEGETLVVDTTNFSAKAPFRGSSDRLHVVERFSLASPDVLTYRFTVDDPAFVRPWSGESEFLRTAGPMFEYACHEANYSLAYVLRGRRFAEQRSTP